MSLRKGSPPRGQRRRVNQDPVLAGMLWEARLERPHKRWKESLMADLSVSYATMRWGVAVLAVASAAVVAIFSLAALMLFYGEQVAPAVQIALFGVVPALSLTAVFLARAASARVLRVRWSTFWFVLLGVGFACAAHLTWYAALQAINGEPASSVWVIFFLLAVGMIGAGTASFAYPLLPANLTTVARTAVATVIGLATGVVSVPLLAMPGTGLLLTAMALFIVLLMRRRERRAAQRLVST